MRKNYQMWLLGALFGGLVLPFAGCSNEDDPTPNGPGSGETFETELTIALKTGNGTKTRATSTETQYTSGSFNGMTDIRLVSYGVDLEPDAVLSDLNYAPKSDASNSIISVTALTDLSSAVVYDDQLYDASQYYFKQKDNIELKQETQAFLFYGKSSFAGVGDLSVNIPSTTGSKVSGISFNLVEKTKPTKDVYEEQMEDYLEKVYVALYNYNPAYLNGQGSGEVLEVYNNIVLAESGAFNQIAYLMAQLYVLADKGYLTVDGVDSENTKKTALLNAINDPVIFATTPSTSNGSDGDPSSAEEAITNLKYTTVSDGLATALDTYELPTIYKLKFYDLEDEDGTPDYEQLLTVQTTKYARPAALYYYVNSYPVDYSSEDFGNLSWSGGSLNYSMTPANLLNGVPSKVAMAHTAQYAVGRLDVTLAARTAGSTGNIPDREGNTVAFSNLALKAILIGNQTEVGWNFLPKGSDEKVIYDNEFTGSTGETGTPWQVLALPTPGGAAVNIALEMVNNGSTSFVGKNGQIIPAGATFYLTAQLNPNNVTNTPGVANPAVFMSDYYTTVTLTLSNLRNAENTVPDLSGSNLEFALSVDLEWKEGLSFNVDIQ